MSAYSRLSRMCGPQVPPELLAELAAHRAEVLAEVADRIVDQADAMDKSLRRRTETAAIERNVATKLRRWAEDDTASAPVPVQSAGDETGEAERLRAELAELTARARRVAVSHELFIQDHSDPGTEALSAQYMLINFLSASDHHEGLPLNPVETALRVVLAQLDEWDEGVTADEIRGAIAEVLPREDMSDRRRRLYVDGKGNGWIDQSVTSDGTRWVVPVNATGPTETAASIAERTGSLREIGRCW